MTYKYVRKKSMSYVGYLNLFFRKISYLWKKIYDLEKSSNTLSDKVLDNKSARTIAHPNTTSQILLLDPHK